MARMTKAQREAQLAKQEAEQALRKLDWELSKDRRFVHILQEATFAKRAAVNYEIQVTPNGNLFITLKSVYFPDEFVDYHYDAAYEYLYDEAIEFISRSDKAYAESIRKQQLRKELLSRLTEEEKAILGIYQ